MIEQQHLPFGLDFGFVLEFFFVCVRTRVCVCVCVSVYVVGFLIKRDDFC